MNFRVLYCCKQCQNLSIQHLTHWKHTKIRRSSFLPNSTLNQSCCLQPSIQNYSTSPTSSSETVDYSKDKTTHFGYQTVSEKEKHENGKACFYK